MPSGKHAAYILSQRQEGWRAIDAQYDDGGYSGGTMERPGVLRLFEDIRAGKVDVIVVYKVDRLTRSLADFAKMIEILDAHKASFVSITQQFNTTSSMGRLTLNVLLSFAQFEREVAGERIRDKIAASKRKGMWMGGTVPLGYDCRDRKLIVNHAKAATVRKIFGLYLELGCAAKLKAQLSKRNIKSKIRVSKNYEVDAQLFIFGFSRGAFTARSLAGFISKCGLLKPGSPLSLKQLYERYRKGTASSIRSLGKATESGLSLEDKWLKKYSRSIPIWFQGVWDTVGALGVPLPCVPKISRHDFAFLETDLHINDTHAYHALAIDEHREAFAPRL
jgi:DNA invertase Pin-like site-specific DNA recombinase